MIYIYIHTNWYIYIYTNSYIYIYISQEAFASILPGIMFQLTSRIGLFVVNHPPETPELFAATEPPKKEIDPNCPDSVFVKIWKYYNQNKSSKNGKHIWIILKIINITPQNPQRRWPLRWWNQLVFSALLLARWRYLGCHAAARGADLSSATETWWVQRRAWWLHGGGHGKS